ncbi:uncharacterized protein [Asterias amurensis]|uniref:uncharacterized protein n=1 Tax=Asterias amurensis TaxID=7602 RepID=UPI003AB2D518
MHSVYQHRCNRAATVLGLGIGVVRYQDCGRCGEIPTKLADQRMDVTDRAQVGGRAAGSRPFTSLSKKGHSKFREVRASSPSMESTTTKAQGIAVGAVGYFEACQGLSSASVNNNNNQ